MTKKEFAELTRAYEQAVLAYHDYLGPFFATYINSELIHAQTKTHTIDEIEKISVLKKKSDKLEDEWLKIVKNREELTD